jgi:hypothetical protein
VSLGPAARLMQAQLSRSREPLRCGCLSACCYDVSVMLLSRWRQGCIHCVRSGWTRSDSLWVALRLLRVGDSSARLMLAGGMDPYCLFVVCLLSVVVRMDPQREPSPRMRCGCCCFDTAMSAAFAVSLACAAISNGRCFRFRLVGYSRQTVNSADMSP